LKRAAWPQIADMAKKVHNSVRENAAAKLGAAAFLFFLVKGLLWLAVPAAIWAFE